MNKLLLKILKEIHVVILGSGGAGHYIKMVHNGIEYAEMQLLAEVFEILMTYFKLDFSLFKRLESGK